MWSFLQDRVTISIFFVSMKLWADVETCGYAVIVSQGINWEQISHSKLGVCSQVAEVVSRQLYNRMQASPRSRLGTNRAFNHPSTSSLYQPTM